MVWKYIITCACLFSFLPVDQMGRKDGDIPENLLWKAPCPDQGGHIIERFENGSPKEEFHLMKGKKWTFKSWFEDGWLRRENGGGSMEWSSGMAPDGTQRVKEPWNGVQDGKWIFYSKEGKHFLQFCLKWKETSNYLSCSNFAHSIRISTLK